MGPARTLLFTLNAALLGPVGLAGEPPAAESSPAKAFMPGVRIDWAARQVEVDAQVVLREGMLELVACSPGTREHESILQIHARPLHVYQALGLLGLESGQPPHWDPQTNQPRPASGPPLSVHVRYEHEGESRVDDINAWLWDAQANQPAAPLAWVFGGSIFNEEGRFAADLEGTVLCVVDFDSALISLTQSYSSANTQLWLTPNPDRVPPLGTAVVLIVKPLPASLRTVWLGRFGRICYQGISMGRVQLRDALRQDLAAEPDLTVELRVEPQVWPRDVQAVSEMIAQLGISPARMQVTRRNDDAARASDAGNPLGAIAGYAEVMLDGVRSSTTELRACLDQLQALYRLVRHRAGELQTKLKRAEEVDEFAP